MIKLLINIKREKIITKVARSCFRGRWLTPMLETCLLKKNMRVSCNLFNEFTKEPTSILSFEHYLLYFEIFKNKECLFQFVFYSLLSNEFLINRKLWLYLKSLFKKKGFQTSEILFPTRYGSFSKKEDLCLEPFFILQGDLFKLKKKFSNIKNNNFIYFEERLEYDQAEVWIDGANVGHFAQKQSNYSLIQVNEIYNYFSKWKNTKIVLSESRIELIKRLMINAKEYSTLQNWKNKKDLCICPSSIDDDQWWIFGSLNSLKKYQFCQLSQMIYYVIFHFQVKNS